MASNDEKFILRHECEEVKKSVFGALNEIKDSLKELDTAIRIRNNEDAKREGFHVGTDSCHRDHDRLFSRKLKLYVAIAAICSPLIMKIIEAITEALRK